MSNIDFSKEVFIGHSRSGEQNLKGVQLSGSHLGTPYSYLNVHFDQHGRVSQRLSLSPSQARDFGEILINYADQESHPVVDLKSLVFKVPRDVFTINGVERFTTTGTSEEIDVHVDEFGITLKQDNPNHTHLTKTQLESLLR